MRRRDDRDGMAVRKERVDGSDEDDDQQRSDEEVSGNEECPAGVFYSAQVDDGEDEEDEKAEREGVGLQGGEGRDQCADSGGDSYGYVEDVVDHQRGCGEEA